MLAPPGAFDTIRGDRRQPRLTAGRERAGGNTGFTPVVRQDHWPVSCLADPRISMPTMPQLAPTPFHLLAKPTGAICNLDCKYCFFLSKEMLYPGSRFRMADQLLETYIRQLLESQPGPEVIVGWQGGEPTLMGLDFFERSIAYVRQYQ